MDLTESEFERQVGGHRRELLAHCYRMLGSMADAEDALQETLLRAWKAMPDFEGRSSLRTWLYRIASRVCLDAAERRSSSRVLRDHRAPASPETPPEAPSAEIPWLEPAPAELWRDLPSSPEASVNAKQSVGLALLAVIHRLSAIQRAAFLLREVMGWSAAEVADLLDTSAAAVNSALQRARAALEEKQVHIGPGAQVEDARPLLTRYIQAWEKGAPDQLAQVLREDVVLTMPPVPSWYQGAGDAVEFIRRIQARVGAVRAVVGEAAGEPAAAMYIRAPGETVWRPNSLHLLEVAGGKIAAVHAFLFPPERFGAFGFPASL